MNWLTTMLLGNTIIALALAVAALGGSMLRRPAVAHVLWVLVLVKLITPGGVRVGVPVRWGEHSRAPTSLAAEAASPLEDASVRVAEPVAAVPSVATPQRIASNSPPQRVPIATATLTTNTQTVRSWRVDPTKVLLSIWAAGTLASLVTTLVRWRRLRDVRRSSTVAPRDFVELVGSVADRIGLIRLPDVRTLPGDFSPMVLPAIGRAVLIVPDSLVVRFTPEQRRAIVAHELAHLRRGDHWVRVLEALATALMWWHPLLWLARRGLHEAEEQCCDAWVVALLPEHRRTYANALVDVLERASTGSQLYAAGLATGLGRMTHLRRRLTMIVDRTPPKSLSWTGKLVVAALIATLPLAPVRGGDDVNAPSTQAKATAAPASAPVVDDATRKAVESLLEMAQPDRTDAERAAAQQAIVNFGNRAVPVLIGALRDEKTAAGAQMLLPQMGLGAVEELILAVDSSEPAVRERALLTLTAILEASGATGGAGGFGGFGGPAGGAMIMLSPQGMVMARWLIEPAARASRDGEPAVRRAGVRLLEVVSRVVHDESVSASLAVALKDDDADVRRTAATAMINVARFAPNLSASLSAAIKDSDQAVRVAALRALGAAGPAAKEAMPVITAALKDENPDVRVAAANALGSMQMTASLQQPPPGGEGAAPAGFTPQVQSLFGGATNPMLPIQAANVWHWSKVGRLDLAKAEADKILKSGTNEQELGIVFYAAAQDRREDLNDWLKQNKDVAELKDLVALIDQAMTEVNQQNQPSSQPGAR